MDNLDLITTPYLNGDVVNITQNPPKEKVSPYIISIVSFLLGLQIIGTIFFLIVLGIFKKQVNRVKIGLIFYLVVSILEAVILIASVGLIYKYKNRFNNTEINIIFWSLLGYIILQFINIILNSITNFKTNVDDSIKSSNINKIFFDIFSSIFVFRGIGTFLSVHIFIHFLFLFKVEVQSKTLKQVLDILIPLFILLSFRFIERFINYKITTKEINKGFFKEAFFGKWRTNKKQKQNQLTKK